MAQDVRGVSVGPQEQDVIDRRLSSYLLYALVPQLGWERLNKVCQHLALSPVQLITKSSTFLKTAGFNQVQTEILCSSGKQAVELALKWQNQCHYNHIIDIEHHLYPSLLKQISSPPLVLFCQGNLELLNSNQIAIVGSRKPSPNGKRTASNLAAQLSRLGVTVTSGLALGIDACAHSGALSVNGKTTAVLGSGLNYIYPKSNSGLAQSIIDKGGLVISEFFPGSPPRAEHFPRRNRIVSGLSLGTLIVEAAIKSGSLITAKYALEQNREIFAVPGNIANPLAAGCHYLIKQGAKLVEDIEDITEEFQNVNSFIQQKLNSGNEKSEDQSLARDKLLDSVDYDVTALDVILQRTELPIEVVLAQLLEHELRGLVASVSGGYVKLRGKKHV